MVPIICLSRCVQLCRCCGAVSPTRMYAKTAFRTEVKAQNPPRQSSVTVSLCGNVASFDAGTLDKSCPDQGGLKKNLNYIWSVLS
ncbi:hypothetical protein BDZ91DRAFT_141007 [Kalaharituber pfeilii]|nr:hypothetical protein BDZ91DRAFT_141007 [Kalaharituber pfeilii]